MWLAIKMGVRQLLRREPGVLLAFGAVAAAVALNAGLHTVVYSVLLKPLPFHSPKRLAVLRLDLPSEEGRFRNLSLEQFERFKQSATSWEHLAAFSLASSRFQENGLVETLGGYRVGSDFFPLLGRQPRLGRSFGAREVEQDAKVVIISDSFHRSRLGGREDILGSELRLGGEAYDIVGVLPPDFRIFHWSQPDLYLPLSKSPQVTGATPVSVVGRLRSHLDLYQAQAEARTIVSSWEDENDEVVAGVHSLHEVNFSRYGDQLWMLVVAGSLILLLASLNAGALLLGNAIRSRRHTQIQLALGAGRRRLVAQSLLTNLALSLAAGVSGLLLVTLTIPVWTQFIPSTLPRTDNLEVSPWVAAISLLLSASAGLVASFFPIFSGLRRPQSCITSPRGTHFSRGESRSFQSLMATEVALAMILCLGAGLLLTSFLKVASTSPGFDPRGLHSLAVKFPRELFPDPSHRVVALETVISSLKSLPQAEAVSASLSLPFSDRAMAVPYTKGGAADDPDAPQAIYNLIAGEFFQVMKVPVLQGRPFSRQDHSGNASVAIISTSLARKLWPGQEAVGKVIRVRHPDKSEELGIVGVAADVRQIDLVSGVEDVIYAPVAQRPQYYATLVVKSRADSSLLEEDLKEAVGLSTPGLRWDGSGSLLRRVRESYSQQQFLSLLATVFALTGVAISIGGLYSTVRFSVQRRMSEWGIRTALGASPSRLLKQASQQTFVVILAGMAAGLALSLSLASYLRTWLYDLEPTDATVVLSVAAFVFVTSIAASVLPARRAMRLDVLEVINTE